MSNLLQFHRKGGGSTLDDLVTVFYRKDMQVLWNRQGIFFIRTDEYNVPKRIQYANTGNDLSYAQKVGAQIYQDMAVETNRKER